jgi:hypothetical protein
MVNNDLSPSVKTRLEIQLHIDESVFGHDFDLRIMADPDYAKNIRILRRRLMVIRDFRDKTNRDLMDVVVFIKQSMASIERNCFGPTGQTFMIKNLYWGQLGMFNTKINGRCKSCGGSVDFDECSHGSGCSGNCQPFNRKCHCNFSGEVGISCDGYGRAPYYPARCDPKYPYENHWYNNIPGPHGVFGGYGPGENPDRVLCSEYTVLAGGRAVPKKGCRPVKQ